MKDLERLDECMVNLRNSTRHYSDEQIDEIVTCIGDISSSTISAYFQIIRNSRSPEIYSQYRSNIEDENDAKIWDFLSCKLRFIDHSSVEIEEINIEDREEIIRIVPLIKNCLLRRGIT